MVFVFANSKIPINKDRSERNERFRLDWSRKGREPRILCGSRISRDCIAIYESCFCSSSSFSSTLCFPGRLPTVELGTCKAALGGRGLSHGNELVLCYLSPCCDFVCIYVYFLFQKALILYFHLIFLFLQQRLDHDTLISTSLFLYFFSAL